MALEDLMNNRDNVVTRKRGSIMKIAEEKSSLV
jgi:hypothetical protein